MTLAIQSTALVVMFKAFLDTDHVSEATGKTIAITISKNGGAFGNPNAGATNATEVSGGWYKFTLDTTDTNTVGPLAYRGTHADIDDVGGVFYVQAQYATPTNITAGTVTTATNVTTVNGLAAGVITAAAIATDAIDDDALSANAVMAIQSGLATAASIAALNNLSSAQVTAAVPTAAQNAAATIGASVDGSTTLAESLALANSALGGKLSGAGTGTETVRDLADSKNRLVYTVDSSGNRTAVTRTLT